MSLPESCIRLFWDPRLKGTQVLAEKKCGGADQIRKEEEVKGTIAYWVTK